MNRVGGEALSFEFLEEKLAAVHQLAVKAFDVAIQLAGEVLRVLTPGLGFLAQSVSQALNNRAEALFREFGLAKLLDAREKKFSELRV